ncbi:MAG: hypothetical protein AAFR67_00435 [Chloroflexota bacterium]
MRVTTIGVNYSSDLSYYGGNKILDATQYEHIADVAPTDLNAVGGIRLALARQKA